MIKSEIEKQIILLFKNPKTKTEGFNLFVDTFKKVLYFQIRRVLIYHEDTNDVLQEVFIKCWKGLNNFNQQSKLSTWVYRITYNETIQWIRKNKKMKIVDHDIAIEISSNNEHIFDKNGDEISKLLETAVLNLPHKQKMVFQLKYFQNLKYDEIQSITGGSLGNLKSSYHHAVKKIKQFLNDNN